MGKQLASTKKAVNLAEGVLPHGTAEREVVVSTLLLIVRDALQPKTHAGAMSWLKTREGKVTCSYIGVPAAILAERLTKIVGNRELLLHFLGCLGRRSAADIYEDLMVVAA
jgi:hypothetical protein